MRPDGLRPARAWVDTGGTKFVVAEPLAREFGIDCRRCRLKAEGGPSQRAPQRRPCAWAGSRSTPRG